MINKGLAILEGWYNTINSQALSEEKKKIASERATICSECDKMGQVKVLGITYNEGCTMCGCPFPQKHYSFREGNKCDLNKW